MLQEKCLELAVGLVMPVGIACRQIFRIGTVLYAEGLRCMHRHGPGIAHCTDSEDFPACTLMHCVFILFCRLVPQKVKNSNLNCRCTTKWWGVYIKCCWCTFIEWICCVDVWQWLADLWSCSSDYDDIVYEKNAIILGWTSKLTTMKFDVRKLETVVCHTLWQIFRYLQPFRCGFMSVMNRQVDGGTEWPLAIAYSNIATS